MILNSILIFLLFSGRQIDRSFDPEDFLASDRLRYAGNLHHYEAIDTSVTSAPSGYKAFYLSHISRHGSRGHFLEYHYRYVDTLSRYDSQGVLTDEAKQYLKLLVDIRNRNYAEGLGLLSGRGAWEQSNIGRRAAEHYPEIFTDCNRPNVCCYHTVVPRVVSSMENFTAAFAAEYPGLSIHKYDNESSAHARRELKTLAYSERQKAELDKVDMIPFRDSLMHSIDSTRLLKKTFIGGKAPSSINGRTMRFFYQLYKAGSCRQCFMTDTLGWVEDYFTDKELRAFSAWINANQFQVWGWTAENKGYKAHNAACILENIVRDADAAVNGADTCATLRFTHDADVLPLMCLIGVRGADWHGSYKHIGEHGHTAYLMRMAGNLQMVFYRNGKNDVIVKMLVNEEETVIPALKPDYKGVFYKWSRLKKYFELLTKK